ncbi:hypothetical protein FHETE_10292 [Fusarium heterosporum]|uniref:Uncharacterized protein n=1 Tax=Fusarium heterosporum TaxID=42747 RepID=A0A8H5SU05_FUSHE|nr:hypothetical protein FHETE_10292 [Fusarium heterosporum]
MAEAIGVIASVATIGSMVPPAVKLAKILRSIAKHEEPFRNAILTMASSIQMCGNTIRLAVHQLEGSRSILNKIKDKPLGVLNYADESQPMDAFIERKEAIEKQLSEAVKKLEAIKRQPSTLKMLKWYIWDKMNLNSLLSDMQLLGQCLSIVCPILQMEISRYKMKVSTAEVKDIVKEQIQSLHQELKMGERQYKKMRDERLFVRNQGSGFEAEFQNMGEPLLRLSKSIRNTGSVPRNTAPKATSSAPRQANLRSRNRMQNGGRVDRKIGASSSAESQRQRNGDQGPRLLPHSVPSEIRRTAPASHAPEVPEVFIRPRCRNTKLTEPSLESLTTSRASESLLSSLSSSVQVQQTPRTPQTPDTPATLEIPQTSCASKTPEPLRVSALKKDTVRTFDITTGVLRRHESDERAIPVLAVIDPTTLDNFISVKQATELGLHIQSLDQDDHDRLYQIFSPLNGTVMNKVKGVRWRRTDWSKSILLDFWVQDCYPQDGEQMVLGRNFIQALKEAEQAG